MPPFSNLIGEFLRTSVALHYAGIMKHFITMQGVRLNKIHNTYTEVIPSYNMHQRARTRNRARAKITPYGRTHRI